MGLADDVTLRVSNNMSTATVFVDIEKTFDTVWYPGLLNKLYELRFSARIIKIISSFIPNRTFRVTTGGELTTPRKIQAGVSQGSVLVLTLYSLYINDTLPQIPGVHLAFFLMTRVSMQRIVRKFTFSERLHFVAVVM